MSAHLAPKGHLVNSFEWFLLILLCASLVVGPLLGYAAGKRDGIRTERRAWLSGKHRRVAKPPTFIDVDIPGGSVKILPLDVRRPE